MWLIILKRIPRAIRFLLLEKCGFRRSEKYEARIMNQLKLKRGWVFIDVGTYVGRYSVGGSKQVGENGFVVAVEPHPENFKLLLFDIAMHRLKNVHPVNAALHSKDGELNLFLSRTPSLHSVVEDRGLGSIQVRGFTLDSLMTALDISHVDAVKIDVEGAELSVLRAWKKSIKTCQWILVEIHGDLEEKAREVVLQSL